MSNEQLAAFLSKYAMLLKNAILELENELPGDMKQVGGLKGVKLLEYDYFPATSGLHEVLNALNEDVVRLSSPEKVSDGA